MAINGMCGEIFWGVWGFPVFSASYTITGLGQPQGFLYSGVKIIGVRVADDSI
jgi:hypothetical protein